MLVILFAEANALRESNRNSAQAGIEVISPPWREHPAVSHPHLSTIVSSIKNNTYILGDVVGKGGYGLVYAGYRVLDSFPVAIKCGDPVRNHTYPIPDLRSEFARQTHIPHHFLWVSVLDYVVYASGHECIVMEQLGETLHSWMRRHAQLGYTIDQKWIKRMIYRVLKAIQHVHMQGMAIRDIKHRNVLFTDKMYDQVKLCDFGLSVYADERSSLEERDKRQGANGYVPPEYVDMDYWILDPRPVDIFQAGVMLRSLITMEEPVAAAYEGGNPWNEMRILLKLRQMDLNVQDLVAWMMNENPKERCLVEECLGVSWFDAVRWDVEVELNVIPGRITQTCLKSPRFTL